MQMMINGHKVYIFYPYQRVYSVIELSFEDGFSCHMSAILFEKMGYSLKTITFGDKR